jgi:hypothetical protein
MRHWFQQFKWWVEFLAGETDEPPTGLPQRGRWALRALWWALLAVVVAVFCGQSSKFIYIDF